MGGLAFASGQDPLYTPRMPKEVYLQFKAQCFDILRNLYEVVESPIDGPGKKDFGDVDIAVCGPKEGTITDNTTKALEQISGALGAVRMIVAKGEEASSNLAVPWPDFPGTHVVEQASSESESESKKPKFIQVDVSIFREKSRLEWTNFKHAHGDIWNLIGATIRPYGLTVDQAAMWLRIPEVEKADKKRGKVFLTADHLQILDFLDLPATTYFQGQFPDLDAMYEYVARCRMFYLPPLDENDEPQDGEATGGGKPDEQAPDKLKANDRRRMNFRPGFRKWVDEFKPECRRLGRFSEQKTTREEVTAEAIARFHVREEYDKRLQDFLAEKQRLFIANNVIKGAVPHPTDASQQSTVTYRACLVKALKKIILEDDQEYGVPVPKDCKDENGIYNVDKVLEFIEKHKDEVGKVAYDKQKETYRARKAKQAKEAEDKTEEGASASTKDAETVTGTPASGSAV